MNPTVMLLVGFGLIFWLLRKDRELRPLPSQAIWIPTIWIAVSSTRDVALWLNEIGIPVDTGIHGNPVDSAVTIMLICAAVIALLQRQFRWDLFLSRNGSLILLYLFLLTSCIWADYSFATVKRAIKESGNVIMVLLILSESDPMGALRVVFVRISYFAFILSIVFIKWFPAIGRQTFRSGDSMFVGVSNHKNSLGLLILVYSLVIFADIIALRAQSKNPSTRLHLRIRYALVAGGIWMLSVCHSMTANICLVLGFVLFWLTKFIAKLSHPRKVIGSLMAVLLLGLLADNLFDISSKAMIAVGKDPTMTGRTGIWQRVAVTQTRPILGFGYMSYWESEEAEPIREAFLGTLKTVHNGYREMYLDGGMVGLILLLWVLVKWSYRAIGQCVSGTLMGRLTFVVWAIAMVYNFSETSFFRREPMWILLLLLSVDYPAIVSTTPARELERTTATAA